MSERKKYTEQELQQHGKRERRQALMEAASWIRAMDENIDWILDCDDEQLDFVKRTQLNDVERAKDKRDTNELFETVFKPGGTARELAARLRAYRAKKHGELVERRNGLFRDEGDVMREVYDALAKQLLKPTEHAGVQEVDVSALPRELVVLFLRWQTVRQQMKVLDGEAVEDVRIAQGDCICIEGLPIMAGCPKHDRDG